MNLTQIFPWTKSNMDWPQNDNKRCTICTARNIERLHARLDFCQNIDQDGFCFNIFAFSSDFQTAKGNQAPEISVYEKRLGTNTVCHFHFFMHILDSRWFSDIDSSLIRHMWPSATWTLASHNTSSTGTRRQHFFFSSNKTGRSSRLTLCVYSHIESHVEMRLPSNHHNLQ